MSRSKKEVNITFATATTPARSMNGGTEKEQLHLTPAEFAAQLKASGQEVKDLVKIARKVGSVKSGHQIRLSNGELVGAKELNVLVSTHIKTMKQFKKNYTARGSKKKRSTLTKSGAVRKTGEGFAQASFLEAPLVEFLRTANFGMVPGTDTPLRTVLEPVLQYNMLSRAIMTPLVTIYEFVNGLRFEAAVVLPDGKTKMKKFFKAGPDMVAKLGPYLTALEAKDRAKSDADLVDANGKIKLRFDRNKFVFNRLQSIVNGGFRSQKTLDENELQYVSNQQIKDTLRDIQKVVSAARDVANPNGK
jgi:hypothetical protein